MRLGTAILITKLGAYVNPMTNLINSSNITGDASGTLYSCQATLEFFTGVTELANGLIVPDESTVVNTGLSGTLALNIFPSKYAPYAVQIVPSNVIDISTQCTLQFTGVVDHITFIATSITGCNYIRVLLDVK